MSVNLEQAQGVSVNLEQAYNWSVTSSMVGCVSEPRAGRLTVCQ